MASSVGRTAYSGYRYDDPGSQEYQSQNPDRVDAKYFLDPVQSNILGIWQAGGGLAGYQYSNTTWTCDASLAVNDPVYVSSDSTVSKADATTQAKSKVFGFVAEKPTTTTCLVSHFVEKTGLAALVAGSVVYLTDAGGYSLTPGTVEKPVGRARTETIAELFAAPADAVSGFSGFSGSSGWSGISGTSGFSGSIGSSGTSGTSGAQGASGVSGYSGTYSGASGYSGMSGYSGTYSGASGQSGYSGTTPEVNALAVINSIKSADEDRSTTTLSDDADMQCELAAGKRYKVTAFLSTYTNYSGSGQIWKFKMSYSGSLNDSQFTMLGGASAQYGYGYLCGMSGVYPVSEGTQWVQSTYSGYYHTYILQGYVDTDTSGTLALQWASNAGYNCRMFEGSNLQCMEDGNGMISAGESGQSGYSGTSGFSGATLDSGYSGVSGFSSESGVSGHSGKSGTSGTSGSSAWSGASGWSGYVGATGSQGDSGHSGKSGRSGYSGMEGMSGFSGAATSGYSGESAASGVSGQSGASGTSGFSGTSGRSGHSGASGATGSTGSTGNSGYSGKSGASGLSAWSGFSGQGLSGTSGKSGTSGFSSWSGLSGASGLSGWSGSSGASGAEGASGFSGLTLDSGYSGLSGFSGEGTSGYSGEAGTWTGTDTILYVFDGGQYPVSNGVKGSLWFDYAFEIEDWLVLADQDGSVELDVWKTTYAGFPANSSNSICGTNVPAIIDAQKARAVNMSGWTTTVAAGSCLTFYVTEASAITRCTLALKIRRT